MNFLLMCKGPGAQFLKQEEFTKADIIAWANIPIFKNDVLDIPKKVDILYLRNLKCYTELNVELKKEIDNLAIKEVISVHADGTQFNKMGNHMISKSLPSSFAGGFNGSTGLNAFVDLVNRKPTHLTVAGLDLFQKGDPLYFFDFKHNITNKENSNNLQTLWLNGDNSKLNHELWWHKPDESLEVIYNKVKDNPNTFFTFYTSNEKSKVKLNGLKNTKIINS